MLINNEHDSQLVFVAVINHYNTLTSVSHNIMDEKQNTL